jgi:V8-like Glu-specific endopeptidase
MGVKLNFVSTHDTTGGNSGSPLIDKEGRYVGALFDGNTENFPNEFLFGVEGGRSVSVHSAGITEALRSVYEAHELLDEILSAAQ